MRKLAAALLIALLLPSLASAVNPENAATIRGVVKSVVYGGPKGEEFVSYLVVNVAEQTPDGIRYTGVAVRCGEEESPLLGCNVLIPKQDTIIAQGRLASAGILSPAGTPTVELVPSILWLCTYGDPCQSLTINKP